MKLLAALTLSALFSLAPAQTAGEAPRSPELAVLLDEYLAALHERYPESVGPAIGSDAFNDRLEDTSPEGHAAWTARVGAWHERLVAMDRSGFTEPDHLDADLLTHQLALAIDAASLKRWQMPVNVQGGPQVWLPQLGDMAPFTRDRHYDDHLARLRRVPTAVGDAIDAMRLGMEEGRVPPRVVVEPTVDQALAQTASDLRADPTRSPFYAPMRRLPTDDPRAAEARRVIADEIIPAYEELALFLANEYLPACRETTAIADGVDGPLAYQLALREHTTLPLTAQQIHDTGLAEVARIKGEMMEVIERTDWATEGPGSRARFATPQDRFDAFTAYLRTDPRFYFDNADDLLAAYRDLAKQVDAEMPRLFATLPRLPYGVREIPAFAARSAPTAYYYPGSLAGGVPGYFMANTYALDQRPRYEIVPLTLHEAVPGHHHQIALTYELEGVHPVRRLSSFTAFTEGWGLYAERLGLEMGHDAIDDGVDRGLYADPYDDFGRLNFEMWRALRLVVDTGIHALGWSREQAIAYMLANSAIADHNVRAEVDRYIAWPGQATAYKIGELKIRELRARAEHALAESFDPRTFHDALLDAGPLPLPVLEAKIDRWIQSQTVPNEPGA